MMRLRALDGWRGLGAVTVALGHLEIAGFADLGGWLTHTHVLVDFFFVLSGFVIALAYADALTDGASTARFAVKRFGRIWPLHATVLALFVAIEIAKLAASHGLGFEPRNAPFTGQRPLDMLAPTFAMLHAFGLDDRLTWNYPSWSVAAEFWTYVAFAALALWTAGRPALRNVLAGVLVVVCGAVIVGWSPNRMDATYDLGVVRCGYGFFAGVLLAALWRSGRAAAVRGTAAEAVATVLAVGYVGFSYDTPFEFAAPAVFFFATLVFASDAGLVSRFLSARPFELLGRWSYSIYLVHAFVITCVMPRLFDVVATQLPGRPALGSAVMVAVYLPVVIGLSVATHHLVELPGQRLFARLADGRRRRPAAATAALAAS